MQRKAVFASVAKLENENGIDRKPKTNAPFGVNGLFVFKKDKTVMNEKQILPDRELLNRKNEAVRERELFTDKEASEYLRISQVTLWRERKKGRIDFRRVASKIIYLREDLENYLNRNKREAFGVQN